MAYLTPNPITIKECSTQTLLGLRILTPWLWNIEQHKFSLWHTNLDKASYIFLSWLKNAFKKLMDVKKFIWPEMLPPPYNKG